MKLSLTAKHMREQLVNYSGCDNGEFDRIYDAYRIMAQLGHIDGNTWMKFYESTKDWQVVNDTIYNTKTGMVVHDLDGRDANGEYIWYKED